MMKAKLRNYGFWVALASALILFAQTVAPLFGFHLAADFNAQATGVVDTVLGILTVLGVISNPKEGKWFSDK
jgi:phi LC3 family holin